MITTAEEFVNLCLSDSPEIRRRAKTDEVPEDVLLEVLDKHPDLTDSVIWNNFVSMRILDMLSESPDSHTRFSVAMKNKLSPELLERLSRDTDESVRQRIVYNRKTPEHILLRLAEDPVRFVAGKAKFAAERIHGKKNLIELPNAVHNKISAFYSSKNTDITGKGYSTVRDWLNTKSFEEQSKFGRRVVDHFLHGKPL